ncbi:hypothetical protein DMN91_011718 [Ooceraea biroi]|uniref:Uncharacterized protein n=1 Tax=Ooceraea biroi TaxID=2015173 RepID=A0A3L8D6C0_OOCBI|nr:hypothetical protein DMN91_011718 [Ooceraea biroi]
MIISIEGVEDGEGKTGNSSRSAEGMGKYQQEEGAGEEEGENPGRRGIRKREIARRRRNRSRRRVRRQRKKTRKKKMMVNDGRKGELRIRREEDEEEEDDDDDREGELRVRLC